ncbi:hypothetical protein BY996DRAFT_6783349 [Phakopsora pachyrhizi]|nr:hypothetical protein BY996DRAFT_6783349 [Phakopsora pachyrhizi]
MYSSLKSMLYLCLSYKDKPLLLFQKLKEAYQNPVFTLYCTLLRRGITFFIQIQN